MWKILVILALLLQGVQAQQLSFKHPVDIDGDGSMEVVALSEYQHDGITYGQLVLLDSNGSVVWKASKSEPKFKFLGEFDVGGLEAAYRTEDGQVFLLGSYQKSDVSPTRYRLFTWHDNQFVHLRDGALLPAPQRPATFVWNDDPYASRWVEEFQGTDTGGLLKSTITNIRTGNREPMLLRPDGLEYVLTVPNRPR